MPAFMTQPSAVQPRRGLTAGLPAYSAGSFPVGLMPTKFFITGGVGSGATVTLNVILVNGNVPAVGATFFIAGTTMGGGALNNTTQTLTAVSLNAQGVGTIAFSNATAFAQVNDGGQALQTLVDVGETTAVQKYLQFALDPNGGEILSWAWACTAATVALQLEGAIDDIDAQYAIIGTSQTTLTGAITGTAPNNIRFCRINCTAFTGGPGVLWAKILQSQTTSGY